MLRAILKVFLVFSLFMAASIASPAKAGTCYADPVTKKNASALINRAVFLNDKPCMTGKAIINTLSAGSEVKVIGWEDGWYAVEFNGYRGWIGQQFADIKNAGEDGETYSYDEFASLYPSVKPAASQSASEASSTLVSRVRGYILLATEEHGEAWYVDPVTSARYYMKDGAVAYQMMRSFGLGISEKDYARIMDNDYALKNRLRGRIILRAQAHGEAYYIHPKDLKVFYLKDGDEAYRLMRLYSLGISSANLSKIGSGQLAIK